VKPVPDMTYNVFGVMLSLTQPVNLVLRPSVSDQGLEFHGLDRLGLEEYWQMNDWL